MAELDFEKLFSGEGLGGDAVPEGTYNVKVTDARSKNRTVFLDLEVLDGPHAGSPTQVNLYIPQESDSRGSRFFFARKTAGFNVGPEVGRAMNGGDPAPILAEALVGQQAQVDLSVQSEGTYAGQNQLESSKPLDGAAPAPEVAVAPAPAEAAPAAPAEVQVAEPAAAAASPTDVPF